MPSSLTLDAIAAQSEALRARLSAVRRAFAPEFRCIKARGYSIVYPAWYRHRFLPVDGRLGHLLWRIDQLLNHTPFWNLGEYTLYIFKRREEMTS